MLAAVHHPACDPVQQTQGCVRGGKLRSFAVRPARGWLFTVAQAIHPARYEVVDGTVAQAAQGVQRVRDSLGQDAGSQHFRDQLVYLQIGRPRDLLEVGDAAREVLGRLPGPHHAGAGVVIQ